MPIKIPNLESLDLDELIDLRTRLRSIDQGYSEEKADTPEYIVDALSQTNSRIKNQTKAEIERKRKIAVAKRANLATRDERKSQLDAEIAAYDEKLKPA
jgi:hypothetical protein